LFFIINWIGKHSYSLGYIEVSLFISNEDAPAVNFLIRVLSPIVYLIIVSSALYYLGADRFIYNIYLVNIYYLVFRLIFSLITGRILLINWYKQIIYWVSIIVISFIVYDKIIKIKKNILPDFSSLSNELWIIIIVFIFQVFNNVKLSQSYAVRRKDNYLKHQYSKFKKEYGTIIKNNTKNEVLEAVTYAILIYEAFNRPYVARLIEKISFKITHKPHTLGVMQVLSTKMISDRKSVELGTKKIYDAYLNFKQNYLINPNKYYGDWTAYDEIISDYNGGESYRSEVSNLTSTILNTFYENRTDKLIETIAE
jgi:hypothetical protein